MWTTAPRHDKSTPSSGLSITTGSQNHLLELLSAELMPSSGGSHKSTRRESLEELMSDPRRERGDAIKINAYRHNEIGWLF